MIKNKLPLGTTVKVKQVWERIKRSGQAPRHFHDMKWCRKDADVTGMICGTRTLHNGYSEYWSLEDPIEFKPTDHVDAYLVATSYARTVYAPADAIEVVQYPFVDQQDYAACKVIINLVKSFLYEFYRSINQPENVVSLERIDTAIKAREMGLDFNKLLKAYKDGTQQTA